MDASERIRLAWIVHLNQDGSRPELALVSPNMPNLRAKGSASALSNGRHVVGNRYRSSRP
jgi:hypothetical protein